MTGNFRTQSDNNLINNKDLKDITLNGLVETFDLSEVKFRNAVQIFELIEMINEI